MTYPGRLTIQAFLEEEAAREQHAQALKLQNPPADHDNIRGDIPRRLRRPRRYGRRSLVSRILDWVVG